MAKLRALQTMALRGLKKQQSLQHFLPRIMATYGVSLDNIFIIRSLMELPGRARVCMPMEYHINLV
jgi:hypothetical protein